jgi:hypothetical protein
MTSPYNNKPISEWKSITNNLINEYPLSKNEILEISIICWDKLWTTKVANLIDLKEVELPATVIGYFFQKLFAHELQNRYQDMWRGEKDKSDKDLVYIPNNEQFSTEMKSSGQMGYKVFGNRSYCQSSNSPSKAKSGYYITVNFTNQTLNLVSIGWIDKDDWNCQNAESGQAATLPNEVYEHKLIPLIGKYQLESPIDLLNGVGKKTMETLLNNSIKTFKDILKYEGTNRSILEIVSKNAKLLDPLKQYI